MRRAEDSTSRGSSQRSKPADQSSHLTTASISPTDSLARARVTRSALHQVVTAARWTQYGSRISRRPRLSGPRANGWTASSSSSSRSCSRSPRSSPRGRASRRRSGAASRPTATARRARAVSSQPGIRHWPVNRPRSMSSLSRNGSKPPKRRAVSEAGRPEPTLRTGSEHPFGVPVSALPTRVQGRGGRMDRNSTENQHRRPHAVRHSRVPSGGIDGGCPPRAAGRGPSGDGAGCEPAV
jgi:hypothetical protein